MQQQSSESAAQRDSAVCSKGKNTGRAGARRERQHGFAALCTSRAFQTFGQLLQAGVHPPTSILEKCVKRTRRNTKTVFRRVPARQKRNQPDNVLFRSAVCRSPHRHVWVMALTIKLTGLHSSTQKTAPPLPSQSFSGIHPPGRPEALHLAADRREINPSPPGVFKKHREMRLGISIFLQCRPIRRFAAPNANATASLPCKSKLTAHGKNICKIRQSSL